MKSVFLPVVFPLEVGAQSAELTEGVSVNFGPPGAGLFEASLEDVSVAAFDQAGADGQVVRQGVGVVELVGAIAEVTQGRAQRGVFVRAGEQLLARAQRGEDARRASRSGSTKGLALAGSGAAAVR